MQLHTFPHIRIAIFLAVGNNKYATFQKNVALQLHTACPQSQFFRRYATC